MLPKGLWKEYEPRVGFPLFADMQTIVGIGLDPAFHPRSPKRLRGVARMLVKERSPSLGGFASELASLVVDTPGGTVRFRVAVLSRTGEYLGLVPIDERYGAGASLAIDMDDVLARIGRPRGDLMAIAIESHGNLDGWRTSPGNFSMTYVGAHAYTTYRTGGFARTLNDPTRRGHFGFRGINPQIEATARTLSSVMLVNHSSNPEYDRTVEPEAELVRADGASLKARFGSVAPFGALERSVVDLFGEEGVAFLAPFGGRGTLITTCKGATLACLHMTRDAAGRLIAIEHSRPTHTYLNGAMV